MAGKMKLSTLHISFPILKITSMVSQAVSRKPTLFEKAILELIARFGDDEGYRDYSLEKVFSEILKVPEVDNFVQPTVDQLINFSIIDCKGNHASLADVRLKDLSLTPNGKRLLESGAMPVFKEKNHVEHHYDPIQDRLLSADEEKKLSAKAKGQPLEMDTEGLYPDYLIREALAASSKGDGLQTDAHNIMPANTTILWKTVEGEVRLSEEGELSLHFADPFYDDYFSQFNSEWLYKNYLAELFEDDLTGNATKEIRPGAFHEIAETVTDVFPARDLDLKMKLSGETAHFLKYHPFLKRQLKIKANTLLVAFEYPGAKKSGKMEWDAKKNGAIVFLKEKFPIENCHYLNSDKENFFISPFEIKVNTELFSVPLGYSLKKKSRELNVKQVIKLLEKRIDESDEVQHQLIKLFWRSSEEVLRLIEKMTT